MTDGKTLLQAIITSPDDDRPRLAYADWLDVQGDADRATFIRVQCALEDMPTHDPQYVIHRSWYSHIRRLTHSSSS